MSLEEALLARFVLSHPRDAARLLEAKPFTDVAEVMTGLPSDACAALLSTLNPVTAANALALIDVEQVARDLSRTRLDAAGPVLRATRPGRRREVLERLQPEPRRALTRLLSYAEGTAGALMDPEILSVDEHVSAGEALNRLRSTPQHALYYVYVVDDAQRLVGVVNMRELMEAPPEQPLSVQAARTVESIPASARAESILAHPGWARFHALPVLNPTGRFLGVLRYETLRDLERRFLDRGADDHAAETASALGEVYALGLRGLLDWGTSALFGGGQKGGPR